MADGSRHSLFLVPETVRGTTPATPAFEHLRIRGTTLGLSKESLQSEETRDDRQITDFRLGANQSGGDITFELSAVTMDKLLEAATMGTWTADVLKAGVQRRFFTMLRRFSDLPTGKFHTFTGVEINTLQLSITANAMITGTFTVLGKGMTVADTAPTGATFGTPTTTRALDSFTGALTEGGSPIATVTEMSMNLTNGLEARFVVGSKDSIEPSSGRSNITGSIAVYFESPAMLNKFLNEERSSLSLTMPDPDGNEYTLTLPNIVYTGGQPDVSGEGPITLNMPFQALYDSVNDTNIIIERTLAP